MTETKKKALALLNETCAEMGLDKVRSLELDMPGERALLRAIEQHEAYKQDVSDAVELRFGRRKHEYGCLGRFIIPKTDPLVEALEATGDDEAEERAWRLRAALAARGLEVRKIGEGE